MTLPILSDAATGDGNILVPRVRHDTGNFADQGTPGRKGSLKDLLEDRGPPASLLTFGFQRSVRCRGTGNKCSDRFICLPFKASSVFTQPDPPRTRKGRTLSCTERVAKTKFGVSLASLPFEVGRGLSRVS